MSKQAKQLYEFGPYRLDAGEGLLLRGGEPVHLDPKAFEMLRVLVERGGHVVAKEEFFKEVWPDTFVEESSLTKNIHLLRKALGDGDSGRYIETVPKRGYRFVAGVRRLPGESLGLVVEKYTVEQTVTEEVEVEDADAFEAAPGREEIEGKQEGRAGPRPPLIFLAAGVLLAGLAVASYLLWASRIPRDTEAGKPAAVKERLEAVRAAAGSMAVLPFKVTGAGGGSDEYLGLGMADTLITKFANTRQVVVRPTSAVLKYSTPEGDPLSAGRALGVEAVLDGRVQRLGDRVRVTVQLLRVGDGAPLWADKFDAQFTDIFAVQDSISEQVARALALELSGEEKNLLAKHYTADAEAHHAYVRGRFFWNRRTPGDLKEAIKHFNEAVERDPAYALAYVGLSDAYSLLADYNAAPAAEAYAKARGAASKALELDDRLAEAHASLAYVKMSYYWDWQGAEAEFRRSVALNPNYATARQWYAEYLSAMGRHEEALAEIRRAKEIDPLSPIINAGEAWILYFARRYDEAIEQAQKVAGISPEFAEVYEYLKRCYDQKGMYREAIAARQTRRKLAGYDPKETAALRAAASAGSAEAYWRKRLEQEIEDSRREPVAPFDMAEIYAQLRDKDRAFEWLEKAFAEHHYALMYLKVAPNLDPLRSDPRFADLLRRVGLAA